MAVQQTRRFTGEPRCTTCHRDAHVPGTWQGHDYSAPASGGTRSCPDCEKPQHYTGIEHGWAHDALIDTWHCADPRGGTAA